MLLISEDAPCVLVDSESSSIFRAVVLESRGKGNEEALSSVQGDDIGMGSFMAVDDDAA